MRPRASCFIHEELCTGALVRAGLERERIGHVRLICEQRHIEGMKQSEAVSNGDILGRRKYWNSNSASSCRNTSVRCFVCCFYNPLLGGPVGLYSALTEMSVFCHTTWWLIRATTRCLALIRAGDKKRSCLAFVMYTGPQNIGGHASAWRNGPPRLLVSACARPCRRACFWASSLRAGGVQPRGLAIGAVGFYCIVFGNAARMFVNFVTSSFLLPPFRGNKWMKSPMRDAQLYYWLARQTKRSVALRQSREPARSTHRRRRAPSVGDE